MTRIPAVGERVYAWRPVGRERHRVPGTVEAVSLSWSWVSHAIAVRMDDTSQIERYGYYELDPIPSEVTQ